MRFIATTRLTSTRSWRARNQPICRSISHEVRASHQSPDREGAGAHDPAVGARASGPDHRVMNRAMNRITVAFLLAALTAGALSWVAGTVLAAIDADETLDRYLRIEYD